jgi:hypothetical protein
LLETSFQKDIECDVQELLVALLLLSACRPPGARAYNRQFCEVSNFLALQWKVFIMERTGTIIAPARRNAIEKKEVTWAPRLSG